MFIVSLYMNMQNAGDCKKNILKIVNFVSHYKGCVLPAICRRM